MPISDRHACVFIHIPRTGGTTVEKLLGIHSDWPQIDLKLFQGRLNRGDDYYQLQHLSYMEMKSVKDIRYTQNYYKFTIVRNPWERLVSEYFWQNLNASIPFTEFVTRTAKIVKNRIKIRGEYCHFRPQVEFLSDDLDHILRFECYVVEVKALLLRLKIEVQNLPHYGGTKHMDYRKYYNQETINSVARTYQDDIQLFGYEFET